MKNRCLSGCAAVWIGVLVGLGIVLSTDANSEANSEPAAESSAAHSPSSGRDAIAVLNFKVTSGAAQGYIDDRACAICHKEQAESYQSVGMSRSLYRPHPEKMDEDFANSHFFHEPSQRYYEVKQRGDAYFFTRYQLDDNKQPINVFERRIDWVMGSGSTSRTYLYQTEAGEIYQLPIAWYTQTKQWGMAPGFDRPDHPGLLRQVRHECMFCHNAYPDVPKGSDTFGSQNLFPKDLPEGIGCQRCHGPGAEHSRLAFEGKLPRQELNQTIVNPGRLEPRLRNDVCFECHLQSSVTMNGVRRFGRPVYSFRPGESLQDYMVMLDVREEGRPKDERFEINHHPYRLLQSRCYQESQNSLSCLTCHDPHRKVPQTERIAHYRNACLGCHALDALREKHAAAASSTDGQTGADNAKAAQPAIEAADCVSCHMPRQRTQDVIHVVMTDHRIQRRPAPSQERLAPLKEEPPIVTGITDLEVSPDYPPPESLGRLYRAFAMVHIGGGTNAVRRLKRYLDSLPQHEIDPDLTLAGGQIKHRQFVAAEGTLRTILEKQPDHGLALEWLGVALQGQNKFQAAIDSLRQSLESRPDSPEALFDLGSLLARSGQLREATSLLEHAVALRPNYPQAWFQLGQVWNTRGETDKAVDCYRQTLAIEPQQPKAYEVLGWTLMRQGKSAQALRYWRHGARVASKPHALAALVANFGLSSAASAAD